MLFHFSVYDEDGYRVNYVVNSTNELNAWDSFYYAYQKIYGMHPNRENITLDKANEYGMIVINGV